MKNIFLALALLPSLAFAGSDKDCANRGFQFHGKSRAQVKAYDSFALGLKGKTNQRELVQTFLEKNGLPFSADIKGGNVKRVKLPGWIEADGMSGDSEGIVFTKTLSVPKNSGLAFEQVYLFESGNSKKALNTWKVPFNSFYPVGLLGDELIFRTTIYAYCQESESIEIALAAKPNGALRTIDWPTGTKSQSVSIPPEKCQAKKLFKTSDYAACEEILDSKSKKTRVIVFEVPMT